MEKKISDPENYYKMSEPFESADACNKALEGFYDEVSEIRKKYKIRDVLIITSGTVKYEDGEASEYIQCSGFGSQLRQESMAAYAFGQTQSEHRELINNIMSGKKTKNI